MIKAIYPLLFATLFLGCQEQENATEKPDGNWYESTLQQIPDITKDTILLGHPLLRLKLSPQYYHAQVPESLIIDLSLRSVGSIAGPFYEDDYTYYFKVLSKDQDSLIRFRARQLVLEEANWERPALDAEVADIIKRTKNGASFKTLCERNSSEIEDYPDACEPFYFYSSNYSAANRKLLEQQLSGSLIAVSENGYRQIFQFLEDPSPIPANVEVLFWQLRKEQKLRKTEEYID